jgi:parallel beta-helix repeat protein
VGPRKNQTERTDKWLRRAVAATVLVLALWGWSSAWCATYYVSPQGNDAHAGTLDQPWQRLTAAAGKTRPGDRVLVAAGVYAQMLEITRPGAAGAPITFEALDSGAVVIDAAGQRHGIIVWNASHIVVKGFTVINSLRSGIHLHDHLDGDKGADFNVLEHNTVRQCGGQGYNGIYVGGHHNRVSQNNVRENGYKPGDPQGSGHGIYVLGNHNTIAGNSVQANARAGIRLQGEYNTFEENRIESNLDFGIAVWVDAPLNGQNLTIRNNSVRDNRRGGLSIYGQGDGSKPDTIRIEGNTFHDQEAEYGIRLMHGCRNIRIAHNSFSGAYRGAVLYVDEASLAGYAEENNHFQVSGPFYFKGIYHQSHDAYRRAYLENPANLRRVP